MSRSPPQIDDYHTLEDYLAYKILSPSRLEKLVVDWRSEGKTIATLNGSFDLMHAGHLHILYEAAKQADRLLVALNSDESVKRYKSLKRPIISLQYRLQMMASVGFVDAVTWFDETNPIALLEKIKPDVHVNGAEYGSNCIEAPVVMKHGGRIHIVPLVPGLSTSNILDTIYALSN